MCHSARQQSSSSTTSSMRQQCIMHYSQHAHRSQEASAAASPLSSHVNRGLMPNSIATLCNLVVGAMLLSRLWFKLVLCC